MIYTLEMDTIADVRRLRRLVTIGRREFVNPKNDEETRVLRAANTLIDMLQNIERTRGDMSAGVGDA